MKEKQRKIWKSIMRFSLGFLVLGGILLAVYLTLKYFGLTDFTRDQLQNYVASFGAWAPIIFILISFLQVTFIPIPSTLTIVAGTFLFEHWISFFYSFIGIVAGSMFAFFLGRVLGKKFVNWALGDDQLVDKYLTRLKGKENVALFFMLLFPFFPDDALCALAGLLPMKYLTFFIIQIVTRTASIWMNIIFASGEFIPYEGWGLAIIIVLSIIAIAIFIVCMIYSEQLQTWFDKSMDKISSKLRKPKIEEKVDTNTEIKDKNTKNNENNP